MRAAALGLVAAGLLGLAACSGPGSSLAIPLQSTTAAERTTQTGMHPLPAFTIASTPAPARTTKTGMHPLPAFAIQPSPQP